MKVEFTNKSKTKSVKISSDAKLILDTIQEKLHMIGITITEQKILDALIEHTDINTIKKFFQKEEKEAITMLKNPVNWVLKTHPRTWTNTSMRKIDEHTA